MKYFSYLRQLLSPISYLFIRHKGCFRISWVYSIALSIICVTIMYLITNKFSCQNFIPKASEFFGLLSGLYVTSISIIVSNNNSYLDKDLKGEHPFLKGRKLNRREFLCRLLGYLTFTSVVLFLLTIFLNLFTGLYTPSSIRFSWLVENIETIKFVFLVFYYWLFFSLIMNTLLCLHFFFINLPVNSK